MKQKLVARWTLALSVGVHAYVFFLTPEFTPLAREAAAQPDVVQFTVMEAKAEPEPPPAPEIEPEPEPPPEPEPSLEPEPQEQPPAIEPEVEPSEPVAEPASEAPEPEAPVEPPAELTGTTLATLDGPGWDAPSGSGRERQGALRPGVSRPVASQNTAPAKPPAPPTKPRVIPVLPLAQLSKHPVPPALGSALKRNYPQDAQRQGQSGEAKVRARIEANGQVSLAKVAFESAAGFGTACRKTLLGSKWSAPLDKDGKAVATWISYRCKFRIDE